MQKGNVISSLHTRCRMVNAHFHENPSILGEFSFFGAESVLFRKRLYAETETCIFLFRGVTQTNTTRVEISQKRC